MDMPQSSGGMLKLLAGPKKIHVEVGGAKFHCWLHPLSEKEQLSVEAISQENLRAAITEGLGDDDALFRRARAEICQRLYYSIRSGEKEGSPDRGGSPRVFREREVVDLHWSEANRLTDIYRETFVPTGEERKNSLRERLGAASEILSTSPNDTESKSFSRKGRLRKTRT